MTLSRQQVFQQLRPVCVELSSVALRFKGQQATVKQALHVLQDVLHVLDRPQVQAALDEKLAEYAFFPLTHVFNQSQTLSSTCVEVAIQCVIVLVQKGWRERIAAEMAKQLLILMSLLAGGQTKTGGSAPTEELKALAFSCIKAVVEALATKDDGHQMFNDLGSRSITDQLAYLLLENITDSPSSEVQLAASDAMTAIVSAISDRVVLANLLPRTASSLTQALRTSTKARRTRKVLSSYLVLLRVLLGSVLADNVVYPLQSSQPDRGVPDQQSGALDESWLRATSEQVKIALIQVFQLRSHDNGEVRATLADLCFMIVEDCARSLLDTVPIAIESLIYLAQCGGAPNTRSRLEFIARSQPAVAEIVREKFYEWCQSIPRIMQSKEDRRKEHLFGQIGAALSILTDTVLLSNEAIVKLVNGIVEGLIVVESSTPQRNLLTEQAMPASLAQLEMEPSHTKQAFGELVLAHPNEHQTSEQLQGLLGMITQKGFATRLAQICLGRFVDAGIREQLYTTWVALQCLRRVEDEAFDVSSFLVLDEGNGIALSRPQVVSDLYAITLPWLTEDEYRDESSDWRLRAVAIECTILQAEQLDVSYRPELLDTLYAMLSLLGDNSTQLRECAMIGLNRLAVACRYSFTRDMLVDNADYLINSVSTKLNAFDMTPQAPQVLLMMIRLCGARIVPQLDDLISSMFAALDNFHGYPRLVGALFQVLRAMVDESKKQPQLTITDGTKMPQHDLSATTASSMQDILDDLMQRRLRRQEAADREASTLQSAPHVPWKSAEVTPSNEAEEPGDALDNAYDPDKDHEEAPAGPDDKPTQDASSKLTKSHKLLLSIAQATGPHLTSPAPQVRQTLLQLLDEVSPLLAQDENSFLPLINSVWPVIVPRMFAYAPDSDDISDETAYNACAAADVIATLCRGAGNFMSSRIDDILSQLQKLFHDLRGRQTTGAGDRSSHSQVMAALVRLLATVLSNVRLSEDSGDEIFRMLAPFASDRGHDGIRRALNTYNPDALWLWDRRHATLLLGTQST